MSIKFPEATIKENSNPSNDQTVAFAEFIAEISIALDLVVFNVQAQTGASASEVLVGLLGGATGKLAQYSSPTEAAEQCASLSKQVRMLEDPSIAALARAQTKGSA